MLEIDETTQFASSLDDINNVRNIWRPAFLQFVAMDCIILNEWHNLNLKKNHSDPYQITSTSIISVQKKINLNEKSKDSGKINIDEKSKDSGKINNSDDIKSFKDYIIALNIQRMLSFVLIDTRKIYDLKFLTSKDLDIESSSLSATRDKLDRKVSGYYRGVENKKVINELQSANNGLPISSEYEGTFQLLVDAIGDLSNQDTGIFLGDDNSTFTLSDVTGKGTLLEESLVDYIFKGENTPKSNLISLCGMKFLFDHLEKMLPDDPIAIINSSIFSNLLDLWKQLFNNPTPEIVGQLIDIIPNIGNRFRDTTTTAQSQQDMRPGSLRLMSDVLLRVASPLRMKELIDLRNKPLAGHCLTNFRSLLALDLSSLEQNYDSLPEIDPSGRVIWLRIIYWVLTDTRELGDLFRYILHAEKARLKKLDKYDISDLQFNNIIPAVMFPGYYDLDSTSTAGSSLVLTNEYENEKKDDANIFKMFKTVGGRKKAMGSEVEGRWFP